jgi:hypothetical protein
MTVPITSEFEQWAAGASGAALGVVAGATVASNIIAAGGFGELGVSALFVGTTAVAAKVSQKIMNKSAEYGMTLTTIGAGLLGMVSAGPAMAGFSIAGMIAANVAIKAVTHKSIDDWVYEATQVSIKGLKTMSQDINTALAERSMQQVAEQGASRQMEMELRPTEPEKIYPVELTAATKLRKSFVAELEEKRAAEVTQNHIRLVRRHPGPMRG